jgi:hypothetical protein
MQQRQRQQLRQQRQQQQQQPCHEPYIVRILWPLGLTDHLSSHASTSVLLGAVIHARHAQGGSMLVAAVLGVCTSDPSSHATAAQLQHAAAAAQVDSLQEAMQAGLGVLGVWTASSADSATAAAAAAAVQGLGAAHEQQDAVWLAMHGSQCMVPALQLGGWGGPATQLLRVPECSLQDSKLPGGSTAVQVGHVCLVICVAPCSDWCLVRLPQCCMCSYVWPIQTRTLHFLLSASSASTCRT